MNVGVSNLTITNISANNNVTAVGGLVAAGIANGNGSDARATVDAANITVTDIEIPEGIAFGGGVGVAGVAIQSDNSVDIAMHLTNATLDATCSSTPLTLFGPPAGNTDLTLTSNGGNLSSDNTCTPYFTHPTDQNNLTNLASTLGPLSDNGGYVPTIPLLQGSPAIDSGVTVAGLTTDARGVSRPQGVAYDSGAYERLADQQPEEGGNNNGGNQEGGQSSTLDQTPGKAGGLASTGGNISTLKAFALISVIIGTGLVIRLRTQLQSV